MKALRIAAVGIVTVLVGLLVFWSPTPDAEAFQLEPLAVDVELDLVASNFSTPVWGTTAPGNESQLFVVDQVGQVTALRIDDSNAPERLVFLDVGASGLDLIEPLPFRQGFSEKGLLGLAFHPNYQDNGLLYTYAIEPAGPVPDFGTVGGAPINSLSVIREWSVEAPTEPTSTVDPESSRVLVRIAQPQGNHNGGALVFGPDEMLYVSLGDGGSGDDQGAGHAAVGNGQDLDETNLLGKILRIDPLGDNAANGEYGIPDDNPFVGEPGPDEAFAYGFRNPFRISFDAVSGLLYVADVGQRNVEEVSIVTSGGNYGWPVKEGTFIFNDNGSANGFAGVDSPGEPESMTDPFVQYTHDEGISVTGGFVYRGSEITALRGRYVFGDLTQEWGEAQGRLFSATRGGQLNELVAGNSDELAFYVTGFGQDAQGEMYVLTIGRTETAGSTGRVYRLVATPGPLECNGQIVTIDMATNGGDGQGTAGRDVISGTAAADIIDGGGGNDIICGLDGDDDISGGSGNDVVLAGPGADTVDGGSGADRIFGSQGADIIYGGTGADTIHGNRGEDQLRGEEGDDRIFGYSQNDFISGGEGNDKLHGNFGDDRVIGGPGDDFVFGYGDDDTLLGGEGDDTLRGNFGDDELIGGGDNDELVGSAGNDQLSGNDGDDVLGGNAGDDVLDGGPGDDALDGGINDDECDGGAGQDAATRCETEAGIP